MFELVEESGFVFMNNREGFILDLGFEKLFESKCGIRKGKFIYLKYIFLCILGIKLYLCNEYDKIY